MSFHDVIVFIPVLGLLVFVHELGHFLAAKWAGIRVDRF
jgi:regulator of sigma E protease